MNRTNITRLSLATLLAGTLAITGGLLGATSCSEAPSVEQQVARVPQRPAHERVKPKSRGLRALMIISTESVVHGMRAGDPQLVDEPGQPVDYSNLTRRTQLKVDAQVRKFARAIVLGETVETRSSVGRMANSESVRNAFDYEFDAQSGKATLALRLDSGQGAITVDLYHLASAAAIGAAYGNKSIEPLAP